MLVVLVHAVSSFTRPRRPCFRRLKFALCGFLLVKGVVATMLCLTLFAFGWDGLSRTVLWGSLVYAVVSTLVSFWALWRLERRRQAENPLLFF